MTDGVSSIGNQSLPAVHNGPDAARQRGRGRPHCWNCDYIQKKSMKLSRISTESYLFESHRLRQELNYHVALCVAIIKIDNVLDYFYLEICDRY
jgi:hypothetical protein